jgi:hypothetical protein
MGLVISKGLTLKSYNTPAAIAGVAPTLDYRFALDRREIEAISLTDKLTYTGATNGTFVNRAGLIERATTDQPRFDHGPLSRQSLGLLVEEQRTNLLLRSEEFDNASWVATRSSVTANNQAAPNGTVTADTLTADGTADFSNAIIQNTGGFSAAGDKTISAFIKKGTNNFVQINTGGNVNVFANFDLSTGTIGTVGTQCTASIAAVGNGWYRCAVTTSQTNPISITFNIVTSNTAPRAQVGGTSNSIYLWGAQLEVSSSPTSYIPTTTAALTRPVDSAVIDGTGVITGTYTLVEKPAGCAVVNGTNIDLVSGFTAERVMVFPAALSAPQITAIRGAM